MRSTAALRQVIASVRENEDIALAVQVFGAALLGSAVGTVAGCVLLVLT